MPQTIRIDLPENDHTEAGEYIEIEAAVDGSGLILTHFDPDGAIYSCNDMSLDDLRKAVIV